MFKMCPMWVVGCGCEPRGSEWNLVLYSGAVVFQHLYLWCVCVAFKTAFLLLYKTKLKIVEYKFSEICVSENSPCEARFFIWYIF